MRRKHAPLAQAMPDPSNWERRHETSALFDNQPDRRARVELRHAH
jgi:hypothetical protein